MNDGLLSQEEIDALLNGVSSSQVLNESDKDLLGEIGNIAMGSASTALSTIIGKAVNITTPRVTVTTLNELKSGFEVPNVALEVSFTEGLVGADLLLIKITDAAIIADLMMGGSGERPPQNKELNEIELSAVSEAMNQMVGSASTALATMLNIAVNISPPIAKIWDDKTQNLSTKVNENETIVRISFKLTIEDIVNSEIMLLYSVDTAKDIIEKMSGGMADDKNETTNDAEDSSDFGIGDPSLYEKSDNQVSNEAAFEEVSSPRLSNQQSANVQKVEFAPLTPLSKNEKQNIDLILDVPLEISVVLGRTKKTIKDILSLGTGSLIELDKLTEEPVEVLVNGKRVALGEVVVIDENFGVRITSIASGKERVKSLQGK